MTHTSKQPLWFDGVCDSLLRKLTIVRDRYWQGEVRATRKWLNPETMELEDKPTKCLHMIPFTAQEAGALVRILKGKQPKWPLTEQIEKLPAVLRNYKMNVRKEYSVPFAYFEEEIRDIVKTVEEARNEAKNITKPATVDDFIAQQQKKGGRLWEVSE